jgi:hypothetical protein
MVKRVSRTSSATSTRKKPKPYRADLIGPEARSRVRARCPPTGGEHEIRRVPEPQGAGLPDREGAIAQLGERLNGIQEVVGSIPIGSTILPVM